MKKLRLWLCTTADNIAGIATHAYSYLYTIADLVIGQNKVTRETTFCDSQYTELFQININQIHASPHY